jgi:hypothetical protein
MFWNILATFSISKLAKKNPASKTPPERQAISSLAMDYLQMGMLYTYTILTLFQFYDKVIRKVTLSFTRYPPPFSGICKDGKFY